MSRYQCRWKVSYAEGTSREQGSKQQKLQMQMQWGLISLVWPQWAEQRGEQSQWDPEEAGPGHSGPCGSWWRDRFPAMGSHWQVSNKGRTWMIHTFKDLFVDFPDGPGVKNQPSNTRDMGSIPDRGTKIPHMLRILAYHNWRSLRTAMKPKKKKRSFWLLCGKEVKKQEEAGGFVGRLIWLSQQHTMIVIKVAQ